MSPVVVLAGFTGILTSFFHAEDNFTIPVVCSLFLVFGSIFSLLTLGKSIGIISVPIGFVTGLVVQVAVESRILKKHGWHLQIKGGWGDPGVKKVVLLAGPRFVGMAANRFIVMTDVFFATTLGTGAASVLHYADRLINFPVMIFLAAGGRTILPTLSKHASKNELEEINRIVANWMRMLTFILIPLMVLTYILHAHLIRLAFQRGAFDMHDFQMTASAYLYYNLGMISYCFNILLQITFFCLQDTATPMKIAVSAIFLNAGVDFFLIKIMGVGGIALATALVGMLRTGLLLNFLQKKIGDLGLKTILSGGLKHAIAAGIMGIFLWRFMQWLQTTMAGYNFSQTFHSIIFLTTGALLGGTLYFVASQLLKVEEFQKVSRFCMRRFAR